MQNKRKIANLFSKSFVKVFKNFEFRFENFVCKTKAKVIDDQTAYMPFYFIKGRLFIG